MYNLGIDIGSVTVKVVLMDKDRHILESRYIRAHGQPFEKVLSILKELFAKYPPETIKTIATTGTGGKTLAKIINAFYVNEITAQATATGLLYPDVKTVIEIGGEDSKVIKIESDGQSTRIEDFSTNTMCAAGTGSFLDQQASRTGVAIEDYGDEALKSVHPPTLAGRCSVFAKTDMIHLQQVGTARHDILSGLCYAMARNFKSNIIKNIHLEKPVAFQGGVAANKGMVRAFLNVLELEPDDLVIPEHFALMGALGTAFAAIKEGKTVSDQSQIIAKLEQYLKEKKLDIQTKPQLQGDDYPIQISAHPIPAGSGPVEAYLGVDVGSISTNVVVIDKDKNVLARRYLMTAGKPIEAVRQGLWEVGQEIAGKVVIKGAGSTGSGRNLTGEFFGADVVKNEITSHATGAVAMDPDVDTIIEIGGQDSKYIRINKGVIIDFTMNKVCAAGTGSFLEEQAEKLAIKLDQEFGNRALGCQSPCGLGERCTVFMESQLNYYKQQGLPKDDLLGGLSYSIVENYLNKVVEKRHIGDHILFQGGVAYNRGVKAAFEQVLGKKVIVPPHHDILGAVGVAILAMQETQGRPLRRDEASSQSRAYAGTGATRFKGFDLRHKKYRSSAFECTDCANNCEIHQVVFESDTGAEERTLCYGSRCGKYDDTETKEKRKVLKIPNLFREREKMFMQSEEHRAKSLGGIDSEHHDSHHHTQDSMSHAVGSKPYAPRIGIPRVTVFFDLYPLWRTFFTELGFEVVLSSPTNRSLIKRGCENVVAEPCFPIKSAHGHILDLLDKKIDYLFLPHQVNMAPLADGFDRSYNCPYVQGLPYTSHSAIAYEQYAVKVLRPVFFMDRGRKEIEKTFKGIARELKVRSPSRVADAIDKAFLALEEFKRWQSAKGQEVLDNLKDNEKALVIITRSYNGYDIGLNLGLSDKLRQLGVLAIPLDFLPLSEIGKDIAQDYPYMYWRSGQKILSAARLVAGDKRLFAVYLTNFNCGPDSYVMKFFEREMHGKPYLSIEIDEHSSDVGMLTRIEAFLDTIKGGAELAQPNPVSATPFMAMHKNGNGRTVYIPYMDDHAFIVSAALRAAGLKSEALPPSDDASLEIGRKHTSGKECFPSIITTGDILKKAFAADFNPEKSAFFMPSAKGPCRFGQYNKLHRMVLDDIGLTDVPLLLFDQTSGYHRDFAAIGSTKFRKNVWKGMMLVDLMQKVARETRPYELKKGETDKVYYQSLGAVIQTVERYGNLETLTPQIVDKFDNIKTDKSKPRPKIGVIGEIYVRSNQFTNNYVVRTLEAMGAEVSLPPFEEWLDYIDYIREEDYWRESEYLNYFKQKLTNVFQEQIANNLRRHFDGRINNFYRESDTGEVIKLGRKYLEPDLKGEAILSMGRAVEYAHLGYNGIMNITPFGCMPGTVVDALLKRFRAEHDNIPVFRLVVDGIKHPGEEMRLQAFVNQTYEHLRSSKNVSNI